MALAEVRYDEDGRLVLVAKALGLCLVRHPGALPFAMTQKVWRLLPTQQPESPLGQVGKWEPLLKSGEYLPGDTLVATRQTAAGGSGWRQGVAERGQDGGSSNYCIFCTIRLTFPPQKSGEESVCVLWSE